MSRAKFEYTCRANSVISEYLDNCRFMDDMYILDVDKPHYQYMADRLTGAWWAFQEQERAKEKATAFLKVEISILKIKVVKLEHRIERLQCGIHDGYVFIPDRLQMGLALEEAHRQWGLHVDLFINDNRDMAAIQIMEFKERWCMNRANSIMRDYKHLIGLVRNHAPARDITVWIDEGGIDA